MNKNDRPSKNTSEKIPINLEVNQCAHNDRDGVSAADILEHLGNGEYGSAARDGADLASGYQKYSGLNQPPKSSYESSSSISEKK